MKRIAFVADGVSHVRDVPDNVSLEDEMQRYYMERAQKTGLMPKGVTMAPPAAEPEIEPETAETVGPGTCPTCGKDFKRLDMHVCREPQSSIFDEE